MPVLDPSKSTLAKYGISLEEFREMVDRQGGVCAICKKEPSKGRLCIDHEHVKGWKKLPPQERKKFVRGAVDWFCNHYYLGRCITIEKAQNVVKYLQEFEERKQQAELLLMPASCLPETKKET